MDWNLLFDLVMGGVYARFGYLFFVTARRRIEYRTGHELHPALALLWAVLWPVWMIAWSVASFILPAEQRPVSLLHEPSKADRAAAELDRRRAERQLAVADWERRAEHWYDLGEKAEAEGNQALKWAVADNLTFLLDTHPEGPVKVDKKTLREPAEKTKTEPPYFQPKKDLARDAARVAREAKLAEHRAKVQKRSVPNIYAETNSVEFCNVCARYREYDDMTMKGMCNECSAEQGIR